MNKNIFRWIVLGGLFLIPFIPLLVSGSLFFPFITTKGFAFRIIIEIVFASYLVLAAFEPQFRPKKSLILYSLLAFITIVGIANIFGVAPQKSFWSNFERMEGFVTLLHLLMLFIVTSSVFDTALWKRWWNTSLVASFLMTLYCFGQISGLATIHQGGVRLDGTFGNATYLAVYILIHIFIALLFIVRERKNKILLWSYSILSFLLMAVLYLTATRGAILGFLGGIIIIALLNIRNAQVKWVRHASIGILVAVFLVVGGLYVARNAAFVEGSPVLSRFSELNLKDIKTEGRSFVWPMAIKGIKEKPILGWGQENFNYVFNKYYDPQMYKLEPWFDRAHNIFLDWGISAGLLGLLGYLSLYVAILYSLWKKSNNLSHAEKSIITGLVAAYFFHNLFVFDHLLSYILFISILAYIHSEVSLPINRKSFTQNFSETQVLSYVLPLSLIVFLFVIYTVNIKPINTGLNLINALEAVQKDPKLAPRYFEKAYNSSRLGRPEVIEWAVTSADSISSSGLTDQEKNSYFALVKEAVEKQSGEFSEDTRYQILAGVYFYRVGLFDESIKYLNHAQELTPGKQQIYFERGSAYIAKKDYVSALKEFKAAFDLAPEYQESRIIYLVGAILASDERLIAELLTTIPAEDVAKDNRIISALLAVGRFNDLVDLLNARLTLEPNNPEVYVSLASAYMKIGDKANAIKALELLATVMPNYKAEVDQYITGIKNGTIK